MIKVYLERYFKMANSLLGDDLDNLETDIDNFKVGQAENEEINMSSQGFEANEEKE